MNRRRFVLSTPTASIAALALAACGERAAESPQAADAPAGRMSARDAYEAAARASGFTVGQMMAANTVYVFFDPACPHCAQLWMNARPLASKLKMVWIPVAFLRNASSGPQGATILTAADPVAAMNEHETSILERRGGISASRSLPDDAMKKVEDNTALFRRTGEDSVPLIVYRNARNGQFGMLTGALSSDELAKLVGLT
ncbi:MAG TPA: thioredoxin fold domain-containing protein [Albitalea sp.]